MSLDLSNHMIEDQWRRFVEATARPDASPEQCRDMRISFFFGAIAVKDIFKGMRDLTPVQRQAVLKSIIAECFEFVEQIRDYSHDH